MKLPEHLFVGSNGDLFDIREPNWTEEPLREKYQYTYFRIHDTHQLKSTIRNGDVVMGGYGLKLVGHDGSLMCFQCAKENYYEVIYDMRNDMLTDHYIIGTYLTIDDDDDEFCSQCDHCGE